MHPTHPLMKVCNVDHEMIKQYHLNRPSSNYEATNQAFEAIRITADLPQQPLDIAIDMPRQQSDNMLEKAYNAFTRGDSLHQEIFPLIESCENGNLKVQLYISLAGYLAAWGADKDQVLEVVNRIPSDVTLSYRKTHTKELFCELNIPYEQLHRNARVDSLIEGIVNIMTSVTRKKPVPPMLETLINLLPDSETRDRLRQEFVKMQEFAKK